MVFNPLKGRLVVDLWLAPMEQPAKQTTLTVKFFNSFSTTDKEVPVPSDPIDINMAGLSLSHLIKKFESVSDRRLPAAMLNFTRAIFVKLDTSSDYVSRTSTLEALLSEIPSGKATAVNMRVWRSALPGVDAKPWQMLTQFDLMYPLRTFEPEDIYSIEMQKELNQELNYIVKAGSSKAVNQLMNLTFTSIVDKMNFPAMRMAPTYRVLNGLIPEYALTSMNVTRCGIIKPNIWRTFATAFGRLLAEAQEERKVVVDPHFTARDVTMEKLLRGQLATQLGLIKELEDILKVN